MKKAPITEADLQAYVDDRLTPERKATLAAWLVEHEAEAARVHAYRAQRDALRAQLAPVLEEPVPAMLDVRLGIKVGPRTGRLALPTIAACALGLLLLGGTGGWALHGIDAPPAGGTAALAREAIASYAIYARDPVRPVEMTADQTPALDDWLSLRIGRPVAAPDLSSAGLHLIGGRLLPTEYGPAGLYLYRDPSGDRIALYVRPMKVDSTHRMTPREDQGVRGWTWADDGLGFGVFGTAPQDLLHSTADLVRAQTLGA